MIAVTLVRVWTRFEVSLHSLSQHPSLFIRVAPSLAIRVTAPWPPSRGAPARAPPAGPCGPRPPAAPARPPSQSVSVQPGGTRLFAASAAPLPFPIRPALTPYPPLRPSLSAGASLSGSFPTSLSIQPGTSSRVRQSEYLLQIPSIRVLPSKPSPLRGGRWGTGGE